MELEQILIIPFLYREDADPQDIQARLSIVFGDAAYGLRSLQRSCQYVRQWCDFLGDEPRSGRPPVDFLDIRMLTCLEKEPFHSAYSLAEILNVSHTTILNHLRDALGMKLFHLRWILHQLMEQLRITRIQKCQELLQLLEAMGASKFRNILTGNESWFTLEYQHFAKWSVFREDVRSRVRQDIGTKCLCSPSFGG
jgi:hypothetical protein